MVNDDVSIPVTTTTTATNASKILDISSAPFPTAASNGAVNA